jgi:lipoate-protein ligase A
MEWTLLVDPGGQRGADNMAIDQALLEEAERSGDAFLRLYAWSPPCLSFGRNEPALARYDRGEIERRGIDVVRRPTGGRAVWHEHEVTYAVAAPVALFGTLRDSYCAIHGRLAAAVRRLGADATLAPVPGPRSDLNGGPCFAHATGGEVVVGGRKLIGSAQVRSGSAFLQHGSILLDGSQDVINTISRQAPRPSGSAVSKATTLQEILGRTVTFEEVADAIVATWGETVTETDLARLRPPSPAVFDLHWTWRR